MTLKEIAVHILLMGVLLATAIADEGADEAGLRSGRFRRLRNAPFFSHKQPNFTLPLQGVRKNLQDVFLSRIDQYLPKFRLGSLPCAACKGFVGVIQRMANRSKLVDEVLNDLCELFVNQTVCENIDSDYLRLATEMLVNYRLDPEFVCSENGHCPKVWEEVNITALIEDILSDKPSNPPPKPKVSDSDRMIKVLQVSDLHMDIKYQEDSVANCDNFLCCRADSQTRKNETKRALFWGTSTMCDLPLRTAKEFARFVKEEIQPDIFLWTGDNVPHDIWEQSKEKQTESTKIFAQILEETIDKNVTRIYPTIGNHECFPADEYDYISPEPNWLNQELATIWKEWLGDDVTYQQVVKEGFYTLYDERFNLRIISLNTQHCDVMNFYRFVDPTDPRGQLKWLRQVLYNSEAKNETVIIMGHIPPGDYFCSSTWSRIYNAIVERFNHLIVGQFFGHTHNDHLEIMRTYQKNEPFSFLFIAPSLTTYSYLAPSFRVYLLDQDKANQLIDYDQYRLDLVYWNNFTKGPISWDRVYSFRKEYNLHALSAQDIQYLLQSLHKNHSMMLTFWNNYNSGVPQKFKEFAGKSLLCQLEHSIFDGYVECLSWEEVKDPYSIGFHWLDQLAGLWRIKKTTTRSLAVPKTSA